MSQYSAPLKIKKNHGKITSNFHDLQSHQVSAEPRERTVNNEISDLHIKRDSLPPEHHPTPPSISVRTTLFGPR